MTDLFCWFFIWLLYFYLFVGYESLNTELWKSKQQLVSRPQKLLTVICTSTVKMSVSQDRNVFYSNLSLPCTQLLPPPCVSHSVTIKNADSVVLYSVSAADFLCAGHLISALVSPTWLLSGNVGETLCSPFWTLWNSNIISSPMSQL